MINQTTDNQLKTSVKNFNWQLKSVDERKLINIIQQHELPEIMARLLAPRVENIEEIPNYLNPTIKNFLPNPFHLKDMQIAADRIVKAIENKEKIVIFGDYDVDGATSSSVLRRYFNSINYQADIYIPDRILEGYGPSILAMNKLNDQNTDLIITVDCGTMAFEALAHAKKLGMDVIVIDHHLSGDILPEAVAIINPNRNDEPSEYKYLAAVGVAFLLAIAVNKLLKDKNIVSDSSNLMALLDLVALGTVCDMVPLEGLNRAFVVQGLKIFSKNLNVGLNALKEIVGLQEAVSSYHLGFVLGPRINAGGRVGESSMGSNLLSSYDSNEALTYATQLNEYNEERKAIEVRVLEEAITQAQAYLNDPLIMVAAENWHPGVIGVVAGRLKELYHKPIAVISLNNGIGKASCRSIKPIDFGSSIISAKDLGIISEGGGHAMAAGFTIREENISLLREYLNKNFIKFIDIISAKERFFDSYLSVNSVNNDLGKSIELVGPYGSGNIEPKFIIKDVYTLSAYQFGVNHLNVMLGSSGTSNSAKVMKAKSFRVVGTPLGDALISRKNMHIIGSVKINRWRNAENAEFLIEDVII